MTFREAYDAANAAVNEGTPADALEAIHSALAYPGTVESDEDWASVLRLLAQLYVSLENPSLAARARAAADDPARAEAMHQLGSALITHQQPAVAATVLARARALAPADESILTELAAALELLGRFADSRTMLAAANAKGFLPRYLLAFATLMTGDVAEARRLAAALDSASGEEAFMRNRLTEVFARIDAVQGVTPLDKNDRRGWHFVLTGAFLLHVERPAEAQPRDGAVEDSEALCREGIQKLAAVSEVLRLSFARVLVFQNPESRRLGLAVAEVLGVPAVDVYLPEPPGLFVAYDFGSIIPEVLGGLRQRASGLAVFSHAAQTTREQKVVSDFTTVHYASIVTPWKRHLIFPARPDLPKAPPTGSDEDLARQIVDAEVPEAALADLPQLLKLAEAGKDLASARRTDGLRERQWVYPES